MSSEYIKQADGSICHLSFPDDYGEAMVNGRMWRWDFHNHLGPTFLKKNHDFRKKQPSEKCPVWREFYKWLINRQIEIETEIWHKSESKEELHDYLGFTQEEYSRWVENPTIIPVEGSTRNKEIDKLLKVYHNL